MPTKKKVVHAVKKKEATVEEKSDAIVQEKKERPVMQVVQVEENQSPSEKNVAQSPSSSTPAPQVLPEVQQSQPVGVVPVATTPSVVLPDSTPNTADKKEDIQVSTPSASVQPPVDTPTTPATPATSLRSATSASETFLEGLPEKSSSKKGTIVLLLIILLVLCGAFGGYIYWRQGKNILSQKFSLPSFISNKNNSAKSEVKITPTLVVTPTPTAIDKSQYSIQVLNGSGVTGEAAKVKQFLTSDGFSVSTTGNADNENYTDTEIKAKSSVSQAFLTELMKELSVTYSVSSTTSVLSAQSSADIIVIIGSSPAK